MWVPHRLIHWNALEGEWHMYLHFVPLQTLLPRKVEHCPGMVEGPENIELTVSYRHDDDMLRFYTL